MATHHFLICIENSGDKASLELRKLYERVPDAEAAKHHQVRVIDESGEDYLYPESCFLPVRLPENVAEQVAHAA